MTARIALVTGAAGGIGAACVRALATAGYDVCINHFGTPEAAASVAQAMGTLGRRALSLSPFARGEKGTRATAACRTGHSPRFTIPAACVSMYLIDFTS